MNRLMTILAAGFVAMILAGPVRPAQAQAQEPDFVSVGLGWFDFNRQKDQGGEFRIEYRSDQKIFFLKPFVAAAVASPGHGFFGVGVLMDIYFGNRIVVTPSFAPHVYAGGDKDLDLGYWLQFRSQLEIAYRFDDRSRLGLAISHYSNASLGDTNPGTETLTLYYSVPFSKFSRFFD